ncbi:Hpt domain-containing protein [Clostridium magnum]|uniref:Chemotaxis protein CheA n=1 Tax=Clostridium magnum DSM 2767 TaxID=1121326 RepID=A0A162T804_9CLOT|nr:Hpt domain-containing protein [Clostridium magnum]KZL92344.1 chemotaxis protein CheA [Clostridium magnum DSM 2767]SHH12703.1 two-component system, chemotaxis family, sensor kinase CheA [Clostridium magnum DSM 2767]
MSNLLDVFFEETGELLEKAEEHLVEIEKSYSDEGLNGLFRCIHSIKGSSATLDFREIATLSHKLEDILNYVRDGKLEFDKEILDISFRVVDEIIVLFNLHRESYGEEIDEATTEKLEGIKILLDNIISRITSNGDREVVTLEKENSNRIYGEKITLEEGANSYFIRIMLDTEDLMQSITRFIIVNTMNEIGKVVYSNPPMRFMLSSESSSLIEKYECIFNTELDAEMVYNKIDVPYVKRISIVNIRDEYLEKLEFRLSSEEVDLLIGVLTCFYRLKNYFTQKQNYIEEKREITDLYGEVKKVLNLTGIDMRIHTFIKEIGIFLSLLLSDVILPNANNFIKLSNNVDSLYLSMIERLYQVFKNKLIFKYVELNADGRNIERFEDLVNRIPRNIFKYVAVDISKIKILEYDELKKLIEVYKRFNEEGIVLYLINGGSHRKRLYNIIESINIIADIKQYSNESEAVLYNDFILK